MNNVKFSHNWNNKLNCNVFTTIRKYTDNKADYYGCNVDGEFAIDLNGVIVGTAILVSVRLETLYKIPAEVIMVDSGLDREKAYDLFEKFGIKFGDDCLILTFKKK